MPDWLQASQLLRARLLYQGARLALAREQQDSAWWLMEDGDLPARACCGWPANCRIGATMRHVWLVGLLAVSRAATGAPPPPICGVCWLPRAFSAQFERVPVRGQTTAALGEARATVTPAEAPVSAPLLPWPASGQGTLRLSHQGSGAPWASVLALAAVKFDGQRSAGCSVRKNLTRSASARLAGTALVMCSRSLLDIRAEAGMGWVALNDPIPAGASLLGSGLGRDSQIAVSQGEQRRRRR